MSRAKRVAIMLKQSSRHLNVAHTQVKLRQRGGLKDSSYKVLKSQQQYQNLNSQSVYKCSYIYHEQA